jgi:hypothetical protein
MSVDIKDFKLKKFSNMFVKDGSKKILRTVDISDDPYFSSEDKTSISDAWYVTFMKKALDFAKHVVTQPQSDVCKQCCSDLELNCFDVSRFIFFILGTVIVPYFIYQKVSVSQKWTERQERSRTEHLETILTAISYMTILWTLGNYKNTFDWMTFLVVTASMLGYGKIAELPFAHESLTSVANWNKKMWSLVIGAISVVVLFAGYHIYLSTQQSPGYWKYYVASLLVPIVLGLVSYKSVKAQNEDPKEKQSVILHIHHVHIFFILAMFTRFPNFLSKIASGIVIGCSLQGAAAYGFDTTFKQNERTYRV